MDQLSPGSVVLPSDFRVPFYSVPVSQNAYAGDPSTEPFVSRGASSGAYDYPYYGGGPLAIKVPVSSAADTNSSYGNYRAVPAVHYDPQHGVRQVLSPRSVAVPVGPPTSSGEVNFLHPGYDKDHVWIPRQIPSYVTQHPTGEYRNSEALAPGRLHGASPSYNPSYSSRPQYGHSIPDYPIQHVGASGPVPYPPYMVVPQNYVDPRHPSWRILSQRGRPDGENGSASSDSDYAGGRSGFSFPVMRDEPSYLNRSDPSKARGLQPAYALVPLENVGDSIPYRPNDGYHPVYGPDSFPTASGGYGDGDVGIDWRPYEMSETQASIVPVDFPVSDLAKIRSSAVAGHDHPYAGKNPAHDSRRTPYSSALAPSPALIPSSNRAQVIPISRGNQPAQVSKYLDDRLRGTEAHDMASRSSCNRLAPPVAVSPIQYLIPASDSLRASNVPGGVEGIGGRAPFVPVHTTSSEPAAVLGDNQNPRVLGPMYLRSLAGSDKIQEVLDEGGSAGDKGPVVTRIIPVSSPDDDFLLEKSKSAESKVTGIPNERKESGILNESKESEVSKKTERSAGKAPKPNNDLMAKIGKAIWSSKPKPNKGVTEDVSKTDKSSKEVEGPKHGDNILLKVGKALGSNLTQKEVLKTSKVPVTEEETKCTETESGGKILKSDAPVSDVQTTTVTNHGKSVQEIKVTQVDGSSKDHIAEETASEGVAVHQDPHPKFSSNQEQEGATSSLNFGDAGAASASTEEAEAEISSAKPLVSSKCDNKAEEREVLVEEAAGRESNDRGDNSLAQTDAVLLSLDGAATRIQARYRGHVVRQAGILKSLRVMKKLRTKLQSLQSQVCTSEDVDNLISNLKDRVKITESAMALLLELDTLQGVHPFAREMRKFVAQEIVKFQDRLDAVIKGELVLPCAISSPSIASLSDVNAENVPDAPDAAESHTEVKEEPLIITDVNVGDCQSNEPDPEADTLLTNAGSNGCAPQVADRSETTAVDVATTEVGNSPCVIDIRGETITVDVNEGLNTPAESSSVVSSREENIATSSVNDRSVDIKLVSDQVEEPLASCVDDCIAGTSPAHCLGDENTVASDIAKPSVEEEFVEPSQGHTTLRIVQDVAHLTEACQEGDVNTFEDAGSSIIDSNTGGAEDKGVTCSCDDKSHSVDGDNDCPTCDAKEASLQNCVPDAGICNEDRDEGDLPVAELPSTSANKFQDSLVRQKSEFEADVDCQSQDSPLPSEEIVVILRDDVYDVPKVSQEDYAKTPGDNQSEVEEVQALPRKSSEISEGKDSIDVAEKEMRQTEISAVSCEKPSGFDVGVGDPSSPLPTEEIEVTLRDDKDVSSHVEGGLYDAVPVESLQNAVVKDDGDAAVEVGEESQNGVFDGDGSSEVRESSQFELSELSCGNPSEVEVGVHDDSSPYPTEKIQITPKDKGYVRLGVEEEMHHADPRLYLQNLEVKDGDGASGVREESQIETPVLPCGTPSGLEVGVHHDSSPYQIQETEDTSTTRDGDRVGDSCMSEQCERSQSPELSFNDLCASLGLRYIGREGSMMLQTQDEVLGANNITEPSTLYELIDNVNDHASPAGISKSTSYIKEGSEASVLDVASLTHSEETKVILSNATTLRRDKAAAKNVQKEDVGTGLSCSSRCSDENFDAGAEQEIHYNAGGKDFDSRDRGALVQQLMDENRRLQTLFREVIKSNTEQRSTIHDMVDRLGKLEQLVKEQDLRKEKRKKSRKNTRY